MQKTFMTMIVKYIICYHLTEPSDSTIWQNHLTVPSDSTISQNHLTLIQHDTYFSCFLRLDIFGVDFLKLCAKIRTNFCLQQPLKAKWHKRAVKTFEDIREVLMAYGLWSAYFELLKPQKAKIGNFTSWLL